MVWGWWRRRRSAPPAAEQRETLRLRREEAELKLMDQVIRTGTAREKELVLAMRSKRVSDVLAAEAQRQEHDPTLGLLLDLVRGQVNRNPLDDVSKLAVLLRELHTTDSGSESALERVLNSETGAALGLAVGQALPEVISATRRPAAAGQLPAAAPPPAPDSAAAAGLPPETTPESLLVLLDEATPEQLAAYLLEWYDEEQAAGVVSGPAARIVHLFVQRPRLAMLGALQYVERAGTEWASVARWLLEHSTERDAIIAALKAQYAPRTPDVPASAAPAAAAPGGAADAAALDDGGPPGPQESSSS